MKTRGRVLEGVLRTLAAGNVDQNKALDDVMVDVTDAIRLAQARHRLAPGASPWEQLPEQTQIDDAVAAFWYLRAARSIGLSR